MPIDQEAFESYRRLLRDVDDISAFSNEHGQVLWLSESLEQLTGWLPEEVRAKPFIEFIHPADRARVVEAQEHLADGKPASFEVRFERKDGGHRWFAILSVPVRNAVGDLIGRTAGWRDIDDAARAREALIASERRFRLLAETASDIVYAVGPDRRVTWVAPAMTRALGWSTDEIVGTVMSELVHPEDLAWSAERRDRLYGGDREAENDGGFLLRMRTKGGDYRWVKTTLTTNRDADGVPLGWTGGMVVVDDLVEARERVADEENLRRQVNDAFFDSHVLLQPVRNAAGVITDFLHMYANPAAAKEYATAPSEISGLLLSKLEPGVMQTGIIDIYAGVCESNEAVVFDHYQYQDPATGDDFYYEMRITPIPVDRLSVIWRDVTERYQMTQRLVASEEHFRLIAENAVDVVQVSHGNLISWVSPSLERLFGWRSEEWVGCDCVEFIHADDLETVEQTRRLVLTGETATCVIRIRNRSGTYHWVENSARSFYDTNGVRDGIVSTFHIIDERVEAQALLAYRATYDALTGVLKRAAALDYLDDRCDGKRSTDAGFALLYIDIDGFKVVNDTKGHQAGDAVLRTLVELILATVRAEDVVGRLGGDEFIVMLERAQSATEAVTVADKLRKICAKPVQAGHGEVSVTLSIGVVMGGAGESSNEMIARADQAMYEGKRAGGNQTIVASEAPEAAVPQP